MLTVVTSASTYDLTILSTVKAELGITDRESDAALTGYIRQASDTVMKFCNRVFAPETVSETFRLKCRTEELVLTRIPVTAIGSVVENGETLDAADYELDAENGALLRLCDDVEACWPHGKITVVYTAGYELLNGLPYGIERAAILLVKQYASAGDCDPMVRSEIVDGAGETQYFAAADSGLPAEVEGLLLPHRLPIIR
jgi:hypothetical protein